MCSSSWEAIVACVRGSKGVPHLSKFTLQKALVAFYSKYKLFPEGVYAEIPAVQQWALKQAEALKKMVGSLVLNCF